MFPVYVTDSKITSMFFFIAQVSYHSWSRALYLTQLLEKRSQNMSWHSVLFELCLNKVWALLCSLQTNPPYTHNPGKRCNRQQFLLQLLSFFPSTSGLSLNFFFSEFVIGFLFFSIGSCLTAELLQCLRMFISALST